MARVAHRHIWKPSAMGGTLLTTLCGRVDNSGEDYNTADGDAGVTCSYCRGILDGKRRSPRTRYLDYIPPQTEGHGLPARSH
jgi:hypothetical protein